MIPLALSLLTSKLTGPIATLGCVILLALTVSQCTGRVRAEHRADHADKLLARSVADLSVCKSNVSALDSALTRQNAAVDALERESEARVAASAKAASQARSVAESLRQEASRILAVKPVGTDRCAAASKLITENVE
jgi:predicted metal-dependent HD superfamily phosphohydrolase